MKRDLVEIEWFSVKDAKPKCSRKNGSLGVPVLVWPRIPTDSNGFCYYGRRVTNHPEFYLFGSIISHKITHWAYLPPSPVIPIIKGKRK